MKRQMREVMTTHDLSQRRACWLIGRRMEGVGLPFGPNGQPQRRRRSARARIIGPYLEWKA
jgi:hypothetical protein